MCLYIYKMIWFTSGICIYLALFYWSLLKKFVCPCCFMGRLKYKNILEVPFETCKAPEHSGHRFQRFFYFIFISSEVVNALYLHRLSCTVSSWWSAKHRYQEVIKVHFQKFRLRSHTRLVTGDWWSLELKGGLCLLVAAVRKDWFECICWLWGAGGCRLGGRGSPSCAEVAGELQDGCDGCGARGGGGFGGQRWTLGLRRAEGSSAGPGLRDPRAGNGGWGLDLLGRWAACWQGGGDAGDPGWWKQLLLLSPSLVALPPLLRWSQLALAAQSPHSL